MTRAELAAFTRGAVERQRDEARLLVRIEAAVRRWSGEEVTAEEIMGDPETGGELDLATAAARAAEEGHEEAARLLREADEAEADEEEDAEP